MWLLLQKTGEREGRYRYLSNSSGSYKDRYTSAMPSGLRDRLLGEAKAPATEEAAEGHYSPPSQLPSSSLPCAPMRARQSQRHDARSLDDRLGESYDLTSEQHSSRTAFGASRSDHSVRRSVVSHPEALMDHFNIKFNHKEGGHTPAQCLLSDIGNKDADIKRAADELAHHLIGNAPWEISPLEGLARVVGCDDAGKYQDPVVKGFLLAVHQMRCWIMSDGLDTSIGARLGQTLWRNRHRCSAPLLGTVDVRLVSCSEQILSGPSLLREHGSSLRDILAPASGSKSPVKRKRNRKRKHLQPEERKRKR